MQKEILLDIRTKKIFDTIPAFYLIDNQMSGKEQEMIELIKLICEEHEEKKGNKEPIKQFLRTRKMKWFQIYFIFCCILGLEEEVVQIKLDLNLKLELSFLSQNLKMIEKLISMGANSFQNSLYNAALTGKIELIKLICSKNENINFNFAFNAACISNNQEVINFFLDRGVSNWDRGLNGACIAGNMEMVKLMVQKGFIFFIFFFSFFLFSFSFFLFYFILFYFFFYFYFIF